MQRIIIFANGDLPDFNKARALLHTDDYLICADGGTRHALTLGVKPNLIIGDMDSTDKTRLQELKNAGVEVELFPRDKNETDLELAINRAVALNSQQIIIVAALGGRLDQTLANIALLADSLHASRDIRLDDGVEEIFFCRTQAQIHGSSGDIVSLLPWGSPVAGIQTQNLKWSLKDETLYPDKTRGVSNELVAESASVQIRSGLLLIVHRRES